jgi:adenine-specific DNA-methyltransferase
MSETSPLFVSLDEQEQARFEVQAKEVFTGDYVATMVWEGGRKNDSKLVSVSHEYVLCFVKNKQLKIERKEVWGTRKEGIDDIYRKADSLLRQHGKNYRLVSSHLKDWFEGLPDNQPAKRHKQYWAVDKRGVYFPSDISWPGGGGPDYEVLHPESQKPCKVPARGWMYPTKERMQEMIDDDRVHFGEDETKVPCSKAYLKDNEVQAPNSVFYQDGRAALKRLRGVMQGDFFDNPKDENIIAGLLRFSTASDFLILDYFAGSGTTGHAVINLNRADGENGRRKYLLVEMGKYFDTVLVPRLKKAAFADKWRDGKPADFSNRNGVGQTLLCYRLESYEDALEHLAAVVEENGQLQIEAPDDEWTVRYSLSTPMRDGELPLSDELFRDPFGMQMRVGGNDAGQAQTVKLDAVATFNWLLGLRVHKMWFPSPRLGAVCGLLPDNRAAVVVWRQLKDASFEEADASLLEFWQKDEILQAWRAEHAPDVVYVNGDSTLWRTQTRGEGWTLEPLEAAFRELMFASSPRREAF